ncbi:glycosyltransferase family 4 protein [uncultured Rhodoblastus sp.]|uniref:glycosyltransferase family 4 protein n=1 Tax=uncultured Rhodoblastus sp. TaxID=543037 RepID=UPI0025F9F4B9|nr:glycosyltransferase family 4 protein [uncultured Rhodoblastus sp.]
MRKKNFLSRHPHPVNNCTRIWFVNRFFYPDHSATSQILSDLAFHLVARGQNVGVITSRDAYDDPSVTLPAFEKINGVAINRVARSRFGREKIIGRAVDYLGLYGAFAAAATRLAKRGDWIVVKTDPPLLSAAIAPVAKAKGLRLVNWLQDLYPEVALGLGLEALKPFAPLLIAARDASLRAATRNIAIGEKMRERLIKSGVNPERVTVIPNWCDNERIRPLAAKDNPLREAWGVGDKFVVGYSGNLGRAHEYQTLIEAAEHLRGETNIVFLFIGGGALTAGLKAEIEKRGLSPAFRFFPYQDARLLPQSLALPDIHWISLRPEMEGLIVPSKFYGIAAAGRPTVAVADLRGEIATLVDTYDCGDAVVPGDSHRLAEIIRLYAYNPERKTRMGNSAREMLERAFSRDFCLKRWENLFAEESPPQLAISPQVLITKPTAGAVS